MSAPQSSSSEKAHPIQTAIWVAGGSLATILGIAAVAHFAVSGYAPKESALMSDEAIAARLKPAGEVVVSDPNAPKVVKTGEQVYQAVCAACHGSGALNAPKLGDKAAWGTLIASGYDTLAGNAIKGKNQMPAKGGNPDLDDLEVGRAVAYMANQAGASFKEPEAKVSAPAATEAPKAEPAAVPAQVVAAAAPAAAPAAPAATPVKADGKAVYEAACAMCHSAGIAGAPKFADKAAWTPRIAQGAATLHEHAIKGFKTMPAKGGNASLPDADVAAAVDYMVAQAK